MFSSRLFRDSLLVFGIIAALVAFAMIMEIQDITGRITATEVISTIVTCFTVVFFASVIFYWFIQLVNKVSEPWRPTTWKPTTEPKRSILSSRQKRIRKGICRAWIVLCLIFGVSWMCLFVCFNLIANSDPQLREDNMIIAFIWIPAITVGVTGAGLLIINVMVYAIAWIIRAFRGED